MRPAALRKRLRRRIDDLEDDIERKLSSTREGAMEEEEGETSHRGEAEKDQ